jgi:hypothetical protein
MNSSKEKDGAPVRIKYSPATRELLISSQDENGRQVEFSLSPQVTRSLYELLKSAEQVNGMVGDEVEMRVDDQRTFQ